ncbi:MAG TPA: DNA replication/repair protein RecF [Patescibacteria group bacterium]|jgi:DNA replication and repair protein RecF|nr:DNA replication/repair protein RecF [Patescibacteria group bacterium]
MFYSKLSLQNFRSYQDYVVELSPSVNIIVGLNGSGKTNLLEALYVLGMGTSFRGSDKNLLRHGAGWFNLRGNYGDQHRALTFQPGRMPAKQFSIDGTKRQRLSHQQRTPIVLFEPDELRLPNGSPARRRDYLDGLLARLWPEASRVKSQFERALLQRNSVLKQTGSYRKASIDDELFVWNIKLAEYAERLMLYRLRFLAIANSRIAEVYSQIAKRTSQVRLQYESELKVHDTNYKTHLLNALNKQTARDLDRGFTTIGPHRDDITFVLNNTDAAVSASRGELRSLVLALKILELQLIGEQTGHTPLLLLDDVFSELDSQRRESLASLASAYQTVITTTEADVAKGYFLGHSGINAILL